MQLELIDNNNHRSAANSLSLVLQGRTKPMRNDICGMHAWSTNTVPIHSGLTRTRATVLVKSKTISIRCVHTMSVCMLYMLCVCVCVACSVWWHCHANQSASFSNNLISSSFLFSARVECEMVKHWTCNASRASNVAFSSFFLFFWHVYRIVASIGLPIHTILHASRIPDWNIHTNNMCMNGTHTRAPYDRSGDSHVTVCSKCFSFYYINNQEYT